MTRIGQAARIVFQGYEAQGVDHESPLEDQCQYVYQAISRYAEVNHWPRTTYHGHRGHTGSMIMKRIVEDLFPHAGRDELERINGLVNQVLRKTYAAVCVKRPQAKGETPTWFVNEKMPDNLVIVALSHKNKKSTGPFDENTYLSSRERKLTAEEAGETQEPREVTVTTTTKDDKQVSGATSDADGFERYRRTIADLVNERLEELYEHIATAPVPLLATELSEISGVNLRITREVVAKLEKLGRIVKRHEDDDERRLRGGGKLPAGRASAILAPAPGPVPKRTQLPKGIKPMTPMSEHQAKRVNAEKADDQKVLEFLQNRHGADSQIRTVGKIAERLGMEKERAAASLARLESHGVAYKNHGHHWSVKPAQQRQRHSQTEWEEAAAPPITEPEPEPEPTPEPETAPEPEKKAEFVTATADVSVEDYKVLQEIKALAEKLVGGDKARVEELEQQVNRLEDENKRLRDAVAGLKQALTAMS